MIAAPVHNELKNNQISLDFEDSVERPAHFES